MDDVSSSLHTVLIFIHTAVWYTVLSFIHPPIGEDGTDRCVPAVQRWCSGTGWGWWGPDCVPAGGLMAWPLKCGSLSSRPRGIQQDAHRRPPAGSHPGLRQTFPVFSRWWESEMLLRSSKWGLEVSMLTQKVTTCSLIMDYYIIELLWLKLT